MAAVVEHLYDARAMTEQSSFDAGYFADRRGNLRLGWSDGEGSLRPTQVGAAWAAAAHFMVDSEPAQIVMPTGSGKTAVATLLPFLVGAGRVLVIAPGRFVRDQLRDEFVSLRRLKLGHVLDEAEPPPIVRMIDGELKDAGSWEALRECQVVVSTPRTVSAAHTGVTAAPPDLFDLILFDEGHHVPAATWRHVLGQFPKAGAALLTATPFRRDLKAIPGKIVFWYPLRQAIADGVYRPVTFVPVASPRPDQRDDLLAKVGAERIKSPEHHAAGSRMLVRARFVKELDSLVELYANHGVALGKVTGDTPLSHAKKIFSKVAAGELLGIACVGVLGEGFDMPAMRIAVYHDRHRSLPATLQFVGRVARPTGPDIAPVA